MFIVSRRIDVFALDGAFLFTNGTWSLVWQAFEVNFVVFFWCFRDI